MTLSEELFERFCDQNSIRWERIAVGTKRTPDYDIYPSEMKVVTEVKEIALNANELKEQDELERTGFSSSSVTPGSRVRGKILDASPQIRSRSQGIFPGLLVLFDGGFCARNIDPYQIRVAMYGFETIQFAVPNDPQIAPYPVAERFGGKRRMTPAHNTSISAIAALSMPVKDKIQVEIFHNIHAAIPLDPQLFSDYGIRQYRLSEEVPGIIPQWEKM